MILAGVRVPSDVRLVGHSDGDAISHAVTDALLGAAGQGDIGEMFSDRDEVNRGRDSIEMLRAAVTLLARSGWRVGNIDITVIAEHPRIGPHRETMRQSLSAVLACDPASISLKGKTNEGMGWIGREEGLACIAVALLLPDRSR
jgi:2-C-methyl-D-erythritol 2,4-cyclodiphosphate synthase